MSHSLTAEAPRRSPLRTALTVLGALAAAATFVVLILTQPGEPVDAPSASATLAVIPVALVLNIVRGQFVGTALVPIYLDSIGTVLVAFLAGPAAGAATGLLSTIVWSFFNPTLIPFAAGAAVIGCLAGLAARWGAVRSLWWLPLAALATGVAAAFIGSTVALAGATGAVIAVFRAAGDGLAESVLKGAILSDLIDKVVTFAAAAALVYALPRRTAQRFAFVRRHHVLAAPGAGRAAEAAPAA